MSVVVYVKHYLTPEGIAYFKNEWFPLVYSIISKQKGYVLIRQNVIGDSANIFLQFQDEKTFSDWVAYPDHDQLIKALDTYRSRNYWEVVKTSDADADPSTLEWTQIF